MAGHPLSEGSRYFEVRRRKSVFDKPLQVSRPPGAADYSQFEGLIGKLWLGYYATARIICYG